MRVTVGQSFQADGDREQSGLESLTYANAFPTEGRGLTMALATGLA